MKNKDHLAPWHRPPWKEDPKAPHNKDPDNPDRPWNQVFWHPEDLTMEERKFYGIDYEYYHFKELFYGKNCKRTRSASP